MPVCEREGLGQLCFSPLAQGALSGKYAKGARPEGSRAADGERNQFMRAFLEPETLARIEALGPIAAELGLSLPQLALACCLRRPGVSSAIAGVTRISQLEENAKASGLELPAEIEARIDQIAPAS